MASEEKKPRQIIYKITDELRRDMFAMFALGGMIMKNGCPYDSSEKYAETAYVYADAMMKARQR